MKKHCRTKHATRNSMVGKAVCLGLTAMALLLFATQYPDLKRYLRIRSM